MAYRNDARIDKHRPAKSIRRRQPKRSGAVFVHAARPNDNGVDD